MVETTISENGHGAAAPILAWPRPLGEAAYHGLPGAIVRELAPHTEADPAGMLFLLLAGCGNIIGSGPRFVGVGGLQPLLAFPVLVGETANGRKGTAQRLVEEVLRLADPEWFRLRRKSGLSSGEGLIWQVRDAGDDGSPGVDDKRLFVVEEEFARLLKVGPREHNTVSIVVREAFDGLQLSTMTKFNPAVATRPHITVAGHITPQELRKYLTETETANGFANRFLWVCVRRTQYLSRGGSLGHERLATLARGVASSLRRAAELHSLRFDEGAQDAWDRVYRRLTTRPPDLFGAVTGRADAYVQRLAGLVAAIDTSEAVGVEHLNAGLALWQYVEDSVRVLFGDATGNATKDRVILALRERRLSKTDTWALFGNHRPDLPDQLAEMEEDGLIELTKVKTRGRSKELYALVGHEYR